MNNDGARASPHGARSLNASTSQLFSSSQNLSPNLHLIPLPDRLSTLAGTLATPWERFWATKGVFHRTPPLGRDGMPLLPSTLVDPYLQSFLAESSTLFFPDSFPFQPTSDFLADILSNPRLYEDPCAFCLYYVIQDPFTSRRPFRDSYDFCTLTVKEDRDCGHPSLFYCHDCGNSVCKNCQLFFRKEYEALQRPKPFSLRRLYSRAFGNSDSHSAFSRPVPFVMPREVDHSIGTYTNPIIIEGDEVLDEELCLSPPLKCARALPTTTPNSSPPAACRPLSELAQTFRPSARRTLPLNAFSLLCRDSRDFDSVPPLTTSEMSSAFAAAFAPAALTAASAYNALSPISPFVNALFSPHSPATSSFDTDRLHSHILELMLHDIQQGDPLSPLDHYLASVGLANIS